MEIKPCQLSTHWRLNMGVEMGYISHNIYRMMTKSHIRS